jgi:hypothetical protein
MLVDPNEKTFDAGGSFLQVGDEFPFNLCAKAGGTRELRVSGSDGFDQDATLHFQVLSNELSDPKILVYPADTAKQPAVEFPKLQAENVTFQVRSATNFSDCVPDEVLAGCPIRNHFIRCDGSVARGPSGGSQP